MLDQPGIVPAPAVLSPLWRGWLPQQEG